MTADRLHTITQVRAEKSFVLVVRWSTENEDVWLQMAETVEQPAFKRLKKPGLFEDVRVGEWGHSLIWPDETEMGADSLWLDTLSARGRDDTRMFLEWRYRHGLSLSKAADALGL